ncbi:Protein MODIFIER OF SNC1 1 [Linum grandiflorum]
MFRCNRRPTQAVHIRSDHRVKGRTNAQDTDAWRPRLHVEESHDGVPSAHVSSVLQGHDMPTEATEKSVQHLGNNEESMPLASEPIDSQAQRAKMKELARQRLKQREKEEEERTREQKAKALAKLEELNRRMQAGESSSKKLETMSSSNLMNKPEELLNSVQQPDIVKASTDNSIITSESVAVALTNDRIVHRVEIPTLLSNEVIPLVTAKNATEAPVVIHDPSNILHLDSGAVHCDEVLNDVAHDYEGKASKQKRMAYRQKQNSSTDKAATGASKSDTDTMLNASLPSQSTAHDTASNPVSPSATAEVSAHPRRKNRSTRNKHKVEDTSSTAVLPSAAVKNTSSEASNDGFKPKTPESVTVVSSVQPVPDSKVANQYSEQHPTSPNEDGHIKVNNQWKPQHSRKMPRNPPGSKTMDKFHGNDAVVWAPVRTHIKPEGADEGSKKSAVDVASLPVKSDQQVHNITKNKRAEMERYVPKPVAKEMAQQGNAHHSSTSSTVQTPSEETVRKSESVPLGSESAQTTFTLKFGSFAESENVEPKQSKPGKVHGSWHDRSSAEIQTSSSNLGGDSQKPIKSQQIQKSDTGSIKEQSGQNDEWSDGWTMPENPDTAPVIPSVKDQGGATRGRRQPHKGQRGNNYDIVERKTNEKVNTLASAVEPNQPGAISTSKEYSGVGERSTSQWQPKSQSSSATAGQRGIRPNAVPEASSRPNKRSSVPPQKQEVAGGSTELYPDQSLPTDKGNYVEDFHQGARRERKMTSHKGHSRNPAEPAYAANADSRNEQYQNYSSGYRRGGHQNNQVNRDQQHNVAAGNRERQRQGTHYEYQPVGQHNKSKGSNFEPSRDGSQTSGPRFRERVQNHPRRGDFHGRHQASSVRVDTTTTNFD